MSEERNPRLSAYFDGSGLRGNPRLTSYFNDAPTFYSGPPKGASIFWGLCERYAESRSATERRQILCTLPAAFLRHAKKLSLDVEIKRRIQECLDHNLVDPVALVDSHTEFSIRSDGIQVKFGLNSNGDSVPKDPIAWRWFLHPPVGG